MCYEEFLNEVKTSIINYLPEKYRQAETTITEVKRNNIDPYYGILVRRPDRNMVPVLDLEKYYKKYMEGDTLNNILWEIASDYYKIDQETPLFNLEEFSYDNAKNNVFVEVSNAARNHAELTDMPHETKEDLALSYYLRYMISEDEYGKIRIKNSHLKRWNISQKELKKQAWENMMLHLTPSLRSLNELTKNYFDMEGFEQPTENVPIYVLSTDEAFYGAAYMFNDIVMSSLAEILEDDLIVLPSSIHESLILRKIYDTEKLDIAKLREVVRDVNREHVSPEEFLSDEVYLYDRNTHQLSIADTDEQELGMSMNM